jgi:hypothetical protein
MGFIGLVKKPLNLKRGFLNPLVVNETPKLNKRVKKALAKQKVQTGDGRSLSPITSEDEEVGRNFPVMKPSTEHQAPIKNNKESN